MKFPQPIVAQQLSPDRTHIVVGMLNGLLAIRRRDVQSSFCWNLWLPVESRNVWIGGPCGGGRRGHDSARATDEYRLVSLLHAGPCCRGAERRRFAAGFSRPYAAIFGQAPAGAHLAGASSGRKVKLKECLHQRRRFYPLILSLPTAQTACWIRGRVSQKVSVPSARTALSWRPLVLIGCNNIVCGW